MMIESSGSRATQILVAFARKHLQKFQSNLVRAVETGDVEAIHDLRVASRRLCEPIGLMAPWLGRKESERTLKRLKRVRRAFRKVRDLDVMLASLTSEAEGHRLAEADRALLREVLRARRESRFEKSARERWVMDSDHTADAVDGLCKAFARTASESSPIVDTQMRELLRSRAAEFPVSESDQRGAVDLHRVRIDVKKLRYARELVLCLNKGDDDRLLRELTRFQESLGRWHDRLVAARTIARIAVEERVLSFHTATCKRLLEHSAALAAEAEEDRQVILASWPVVAEAVKSSILFEPMGDSESRRMISDNGERHHRRNRADGRLATSN